jgi:predicted transcriptional regulator
MKRLSDRMDLAKAVLKELNRQQLSRTDLERLIVRKTGTHATFDGIIRYLFNDGFVQKTEQKLRANYVITEKGRKLLEALT